MGTDLDSKIFETSRYTHNNGEAATGAALGLFLSIRVHVY